ncbi:MAG TPA: HEAT repeat domain-containing protein [Nannocystaceae bacterium]|nr:HEAT repeat domain-containing protein [Nannocystaceae bacterium]
MSRTVARPSPAEAERIARAKSALTDGTNGIRTVVRQLDDPSWVVRRALVDLLARAGEHAVEPMLTALQESRDHEARIAALVDALVASVAELEDSMIALCDHGDPAVAADAVQVLGRRRSRAAIPRLRQLVAGNDDNVAVAAIEALGRIGGRAAVESLVSAVKSGKFFRTFPAIDVLGRTGDPRGIAPLAELLDDPAYMHEAARALGHTGDPAAVAPLLELAKRTPQALVRVSATALAELREHYALLYGSPDAIDLLIRDRASSSVERRMLEALRASAPAEQAAMVRIIGAVGGPGAAAALVEYLDGSDQVARAAAEVLRKLGDAGALTPSHALRDGDSARRRLVLEVLQPRAVSADDVRIALGDPDGTVRAKAAELLGRIGQLSVVPALFDVLADPNPRVAHAALGAIQALGGEVTEQLALAGARSTDARLRRQSLRIIGYFGYISAVDLLIEALGDDDSQLRELAVQSLGAIENARAHAAIVRVARHGEPKLRAAAMRAAAQLPAREAAPLLVAALDDDDPWARYYACQSLGRLRHEPSAVAIAARLSDAAGQVRVAAIEALSQLRSSVAEGHLGEAVRAADQDVRRAALMGMAITRRDGWLPLVVEASHDVDPATRLVSCSALAAFAADEAAVRLGVLAWEDPDESVRLAALSALGERSGAAAVLALVKLLARAEAHHRVRELLASPVAGRIAGIATALGDADEETASILTSALARMRSPEAITALASALVGPNPAARKAAVITAAAIGTSSLVDTIRARLTTDPDAEVRRVIASALRS